jgi:hypothetical protein
MHLQGYCCRLCFCGECGGHRHLRCIRSTSCASTRAPPSICLVAASISSTSPSTSRVIFTTVQSLWISWAFFIVGTSYGCFPSITFFSMATFEGLASACCSGRNWAYYSGSTWAGTFLGASEASYCGAVGFLALALARGGGPGMVRYGAHHTLIPPRVPLRIAGWPFLSESFMVVGHSPPVLAEQKGYEEESNVI